MTTLTASAMGMCTPQEVELLLACARVGIDAGGLARIAALCEEPIDWTRLLQRAAAHGLVPLVSRTLRAARPPALPDDVLVRLGGASLATTHRNLYLTAELLRVLALLDAEGIAAIPFKGPVLAAQVYGDLSLRPFGDLDVIVRRADLGRATAALLADRYRMPSADAGAAVVRRWDDVQLMRDDGRAVVELQCGIFRWPIRFPHDYGLLWEHLSAATIGGRQVPTFPLDALIIYLCVHGAKHRWERLVWVRDVAAIASGAPALDWEPVWSSAVRLGAQRMLAIGLLLAQRAFTAAIPEPVLRRARGDATAARLAGALFDDLVGEMCAPGAKQVALPMFYLHMMERLRDRARLCVRLAPDVFRPHRRQVAGGEQRPQDVAL